MITATAPAEITLQTLSNLVNEGLSSCTKVSEVLLKIPSKEGNEIVTADLISFIKIKEGNGEVHLHDYLSEHSPARPVRNSTMTSAATRNPVRLSITGFETNTRPRERS
jgi:hypothetical protein